MNDRIRLLYESVLNEGYDTSLEREYTIETSLDGIKELAESIGIDTSIIRVEYIAEQLGFVGLLNESTGEMVYILEKFDLKAALTKAKQIASDGTTNLLKKVDDTELSRKVAEKLRKFTSQNISHSYLRNKAVKELGKIDYNEKIENLKNIINYNTDSTGLGSEIANAAFSKFMDMENEKIRREFYPLIGGKTLTQYLRKPTTPLNDLMINSSPKGKFDNIDKKKYGLVSGIVNSDEYTDRIKGQNSNRHDIDSKGNKKKRAGQTLGHSTSDAKILNTPAGNNVFIRNFDKPYYPNDRDSIGRLIGDISTMTRRVYPHELRHVEDHILQGEHEFKKDRGSTGYADDPREIRAREAEKDVSKKMKYSWIPALAKGVGENIYKRVTGRGTGSKGDTMDDTFKNTLKKEYPEDYNKIYNTEK